MLRPKGAVQATGTAGGHDFFVLNLCAVTMGEERKTVDNCFSRTKSTKQREMKQGYALSTFRLCDLTGHVELKTVRPKATGVRI